MLTSTVLFLNLFELILQTQNYIFADKKCAQINVCIFPAFVQFFYQVLYFMLQVKKLLLVLLVLHLVKQPIDWMVKICTRKVIRLHAYFLRNIS
jgi:hypothetical protein